MHSGERKEDLCIQDKSGHQYRVHLSETPRWYLKVWDGPVMVGYANCHVEPQVLFVDDLRVDDKALRPASNIRHFMHHLLKRPDQPINYRRRGIGTALLKLIAGLAAERGFTAIEGSISKVDLDNNPNLPAWYRQRGFAVLPGARHGSRKVRLELNF